MDHNIGGSVVARWSRWVEELAAQPLDRFEYEGLLECRDLVAHRLKMTGDGSEESIVDEADAEFERLTVARDGSQPRSPAVAWWRDRLPADPRWREYLEL